MNTQESEKKNTSKRRGGDKEMNEQNIKDILVLGVICLILSGTLLMCQKS